MAPPNASAPAPAVCGNGRRDEMLGGSRDLNSPDRTRDQRLLALDFIGELGDHLVVAGAAIAAAASAENVGVIEATLRSARAVLVDAIGEFKALAPQEDGGAQ